MLLKMCIFRFLLMTLLLAVTNHAIKDGEFENFPELTQHIVYIRNFRSKDGSIPTGVPGGPKGPMAPVVEAHQIYQDAKAGT